MRTKVTGPYGTFDTIADAARAIAHTDGPNFIKKYPNYDFPYNPSEEDRYADHTGEGGHNNSTIHYIYRIIEILIGPVGTKNGLDGWKRC